MQSSNDQRVIFFDDSLNTFTDYTRQINDWNNAQTVALVVEPEDYIYIASFLPFNHKYFQFATASASDRVPIIEMLNAPAEWSESVDQIDYTRSMRASGVLQWTPNIDKNWGLVSESSRDIAALANGPTIYQSYWLRISFAATATFTLDYVGQLFSSDLDLYQEYPILQNSNILSGWKSGKTTWLDQHLLAAQYVSKTLIARDLAISNNQILDISSLRSPAVHKTAQIIFSGLGAKNYEAEIKQATVNFEKAMNQDKFRIDKNANARVDRAEVSFFTTSRATR